MIDINKNYNESNLDTMVGESKQNTNGNTFGVMAQKALSTHIVSITANVLFTKLC